MNVQDAQKIQIPEGEVRCIHDKDNRLLWGRLEYDTKYEGNTWQQTTPTPDYPQQIKVVEGAQTVTIDGTNFALSLGNIELSKIDTYKDYFYKDGNDWKLKKQVGKVTLNGSETITLHRDTGAVKGFRVAIGVDVKNSSEVVSDYFRYSTFNIYYSDLNRAYGLVSDHDDNILQNLYFSSPDSSVTTVAQFSTWLSTHNTTAYYVLATPTDIIVTDTTLIAQLNAISEWMNRYGYQATVSGDLPIVINQESL